jgi:D-hexose-6-phosphate mutarotase
MKNSDKLNAEFGSDKIHFYEGAGEFTFVDLENNGAKATLCLYGAQITTFQPAEHKPVIWLSEKSHYKKENSIRGGIPVCWPWFSSHPTDSTLPKHGFARFQNWQVISTSSQELSTTIKLSLSDTKETRKLWDHKFKVNLTVNITDNKLELIISTQNIESTPITIGAALHPYFQVGDIHKTTVQGLAGTTYIDFADAQQKIVETKEVEITKTIDRVYLNTTNDCIIKDNANKRQIKISKTGSKTTVIWNPWLEGATNMNDMPDNGYQTMLCVEPANMLNDVYTLLPNDTHTLSMTISTKTIHTE